MRENRLSGLEGGEDQLNDPSLPLSLHELLVAFWRLAHFPTRSLCPSAPTSAAISVIVNQNRGQANDDLAPGNETDDPPLPRVVLHPAVRLLTEAARL